MRNKKGFVNKPIDIAAGFIIAIIGAFILAVVYALASNINIDDTLTSLDNRLALHEYTLHVYEDLAVAEYIMYHPIVANEEDTKELIGFAPPRRIQQVVEEQTAIGKMFSDKLQKDLEAATEEFFKQFGSKWMIIITYPDQYEQETLFFNKKRMKQSVGTTYVPLPNGGYATVELFYPLDLVFVPFGMQAGLMPMLI